MRAESPYTSSSLVGCSWPLLLGSPTVALWRLPINLYGVCNGTVQSKSALESILPKPLSVTANLLRGICILHSSGQPLRKRAARRSGKVSSRPTSLLVIVVVSRTYRSLAQSFCGLGSAVTTVVMRNAGCTRRKANRELV